MDHKDYDRLRRLHESSREDGLRLLFEWVKTGVIGRKTYLWLMRELDMIYRM